MYLRSTPRWKRFQSMPLCLSSAYPELEPLFFKGCFRRYQHSGPCKIGKPINCLCRNALLLQNKCNSRLKQRRGKLMVSTGYHPSLSRRMNWAPWNRRNATHSWCPLFMHCCFANWFMHRIISNMFSHQILVIVTPCIRNICKRLASTEKRKLGF